MYTRFCTLMVVLVAGALLGVAGCGDDDGGGGALANCGNGVVDSGEACDDGNDVDLDGCLASCQVATCGDGFVWAGVEQCEFQTLGGATCQSLGFASGQLSCSTACTFDTSACSGTGGATPTPAPTESPEDTPTATNPAPTPTPGSGGGGSCTFGDPVVVLVGIDAAYGAARIDLRYPSDQINLPGSGTTQNVVDRVTFAGTGLNTVNDDDNTSTLTMSLVSFTEQSAGTFATVTFDCTVGVPEPAAFTCTVVSASTPGGVAIPDAGCTVAIQ